MSTWGDTAYLHRKRKIDRPEMARQLQRAVDLIMPRVKGTALDIGCGDGSNMESIAKNAPNARLVGIDIAYKLTHQGKEGKDPSVTNIEYIVADASYLPFRDDAFDLVFALATLHHVVALERCVNDIARVCKDELVIVEPNKFSHQSLFLGSRAPFKFVWRGGMDPHERPLSPLFIKSILNRGRFKNVDIKARTTIPSIGFVSDLFKINAKWLILLDEKITRIINKTFLRYFCSTFILTSRAR
jgi:ubiquinone/menaquinone biosynthesis C-methylase UbiE